MMLRRAGLGLLVGAVLMASSGTSAGPALVFEPYNGTVFYAEDPDAQWFPGLPHQADDGLRHLPGAEGRHRHARHQAHMLQGGDGAGPEQALAESGRVDHARRRAQGPHRRVGQRRRRHDRRGGRRQSGGVRPAHERGGTASRHERGPISPTSTACPTSAKSPPPATLPSSRAPSSSRSPSTPICSPPSRFRSASRSCARITAYW